MSQRSLSIFFPMYNERENIAATLRQALEVIPKLGFDDYEILIVDDGSKDGSADVVRAWAARDPHVRLVQHAQNQGYGAALRTGFTTASRELVFYTDSDLPIDLGEIARALPPILDGDADLVIGYRKNRYDTLRRALYSRVYNKLMRILFGVRVRDVNFSFKLVHRRVLDRVKLSAATVFIDGQLLAEARRHGFRVAELPIDYRPRVVGTSSFNSLRAAWVTLVEMLRYRVLPATLPAPAPTLPMAPPSVPPDRADNAPPSDPAEPRITDESLVAAAEPLTGALTASGRVSLGARASLG